MLRHLAHALLYFALLMLISAIMWQLKSCEKNTEKVVPYSKYSELFFYGENKFFKFVHLSNYILNQIKIIFLVHSC